MKKAKTNIPAFYLDDEQSIAEKFGGKSLFEIFRNIHQSNYWDNQGSVSGPGSDEDQTATIRKELPKLFREMGVQSILDAPCGDLAWMESLDFTDIRYTGVDIVPEIIDDNRQRFAGTTFDFFQADLTSDPLPRTDLVLCRDCLVHFSEQNIRLALKNFIATGASWLLMTSFTGDRPFREMPDGGWRAINFTLPPLGLPKPTFILYENCTELDGQYTDKALCLWSMEEIKDVVQDF